MRYINLFFVLFFLLCLAPTDISVFQFLKKFLHYSKHRIHPELTEDAREHISSAYASLRSKQVGDSLLVHVFLNE